MCALKALAETITARARTPTIANVLCLSTGRVGGDNHGKGKNCYNHAALGNIPSWGATNSNHAFREHVCCAKPAKSTTTKFFNSANSDYKNTMSWTQARQFCVSSGYKNLCTAKEFV